MAKKEKTIIFSEWIDSRINGYAIGISLLIVSLFLLFNATYFHFKVITYVVGSIFGVLGVAGLGTELDKSKKFKGIGNLISGLVFLGIWIVVFHFWEGNILLNIFTMPALFVGLFGFVKGLMELFYSIWLELANAQRSFPKITKALLVFFTQLCGLALTILNILRIFAIV